MRFRFAEMMIVVTILLIPWKTFSMVILQKKLNPNQNNMAIFFMPEQTFNVFSMLQGINCDVEITEKDLEKMISVVLKSEESSLKNHILKKLKVLLEFIENGNKVFPFPTPTDNLKEVNY